MNDFWKYQILVPRSKEQLEEADGYVEELRDAQTFIMNEREFVYLSKKKGLFEAFEKEFHIIIMEGEEERIEAEQIDAALRVTKEKSRGAQTEQEKKAYKRVLDALETAEKRGVFAEFVVIPKMER